MNAPILVTGGTGQVGSAFARIAKQNGFEIYAPSRHELDLATPSLLRSALAGRRWQAIINCAAFTAVDKAESEPELAHAINATAPAILAEIAQEQNVPLIHISTDYVFDGQKRTPYSEDDAINPLNVYGRTKAEGEAAILASNGAHAIIRTSWLLNSKGANFLNTMLRLGASQAHVILVVALRGCPS